MGGKNDNRSNIECGINTCKHPYPELYIGKNSIIIIRIFNNFKGAKCI